MTNTTCFVRFPIPLFILFAAQLAGAAAPGWLDGTFGHGGKVRIGFGGGFADCKAAVVQSDGKLVLAGFANNMSSLTGGGFALARFDASQHPDAAFGEGGHVVTTVGIQTNAYYGVGASAVKVQSDGKIVAGGQAYFGPGYPNCTVIRYNSDGSIDANYGTNGTGIVYLDVGQAGRISAMGIQADGKVVVAGYLGYPGASSPTGYVLARYLTNGVLDASFGTGGVVLVSEASEYTTIYSLMLLANGRIVTAGSGGKSGENGIDFSIRCFTTNGVPDPTFGGGTGHVETRIAPGSSSSYLDYATALGYQSGDNTIQNPDKLVAAGYHWDFGSDRIVFAVVRYKLDGTLDTTFGNGGIVTNAVTSGTGLGGDLATSVIVQGTSFQPRKITVAGYSLMAGGEYISVIRLNGAGALDSTFNGTGTLTFSLNPYHQDAANAMVLQAGQIVLAGTSQQGQYNNVFAAVRLTATGTFDTNFGTGGVITADISDRAAQANAVLVQPDGKVLAGGSCNDGSHNRFALARLLDNGALDPAFGNAGLVISTLYSNDSINALALQPDGKIVAGGSSSENFALLRYNPDGSLDSSFGTGGKVAVPLGNSAEIHALRLLPDGRIVAAGGSDDTGSSYQDFAIARFTTNGSLDASFGSGGKAFTSFGYPSINVASSLGLQADGKYVLAGLSEFVSGSSVAENMALTRYNTNGTLDFSFGSLGRVSTNIASGTLDAANAMVLQPNGRIVVAGSASIGLNSYVALARFQTNGLLDASFGSGGGVISQVGASSDYAMALALQADGKLLAAGSSQNGTYKYFLQRFNADGSPDDSFGDFGTTVLDFGSDRDEFAYALTLDAAGRAIIAGDGGNAFGLARVGSLPALRITHASASSVRVAWPWPSSGWHLQQRGALNSGNWSAVTDTVNNDGMENFITVTATSGPRFYRLAYP